MQNPAVLEERLLFSRQVWGQVGNVEPLDSKTALDPRFVLALSNDYELPPVSPPVNNTFTLVRILEFPPIPPSIAVLPNLQLKIVFPPNSTGLTKENQQILEERILPLLRSSTYYIKITGTSGETGPLGTYTPTEVIDFGLQRAGAVWQYLTNNGINQNRLVLSAVPSPDNNSPEQKRMVILEFFIPTR
jgi:hypothetical protein